MVHISLILHWNGVSIPNVCNKYLIPGKVAFALTRALSKECIDKDIKVNRVVLHHAFIFFKHLGKTRVVTVPYHQQPCDVKRSLRRIKINHPIGIRFFYI